MRFAHSAAGIAAILAFVTIASPSFVEARERQTYAEGMKSCIAYCDRVNQTNKSRRFCYSKCDAYWALNGSDGTSVQVNGQ